MNRSIEIHAKVVVLSSVSSPKSIILYNYIKLDGPKADAIVVGIGTGDQEQGSMDSTCQSKDMLGG